MKMNPIWIPAILTIIVAAIGIASTLFSAFQTIKDANEAAVNEKDRADQAAALLINTEETLCNTQSSLYSTSILLGKTDESLKKAEENLTNSQNMLEQQKDVIKSQEKLLSGYKTILENQTESYNYMTGGGVKPRFILNIDEIHYPLYRFKFTLKNPSSKYPISNVHYEIKQHFKQLRPSDGVTGQMATALIDGTPKGDIPSFLPGSQGEINLFTTTVLKEVGSERFDIICKWRDGSYVLDLMFQADKDGNLQLYKGYEKGVQNPFGDIKPFIDIRITQQNQK